MTLSPTRRNVLLPAPGVGRGAGLDRLCRTGAGGVHLSLGEVWSGLLGGHPGSEASVIVRDIRLPRILLAMLVGAALAVSGTGLQSHAAQSPGGSLRPGNIQRRGARRNRGPVDWRTDGVRNSAYGVWGAVLTMSWVYLLGRRARSPVELHALAGRSA